MFDEEYCAERHLPEDKYFDENTGSYMARNQMKWFLTQVGVTPPIPTVHFLQVSRLTKRHIQGSELSSLSRVRHTFFAVYDASVKVLEEIEEFYVSDAAIPPPRMTDSVLKLCTVSWSNPIKCSSIPLRKSAIGGSKYRRLEFDIEMTCDGLSIEFAVYFKKKRVAERSVVVEYYNDQKGRALR